VALLCRPVVVPQHDMGAQASPSRTRSPDPKVVGESLADDTQTASPPRGRLRVGKLRRRWRIRGWRVPRAQLKREKELLLGTSERQPPQESLMSTPSVRDLLGLTTLSRTSLKLTSCQEVWGHLAHRYPSLPVRARDYRGGKLTRMTPLGKMISSRTMRI
jgi:hypothetical protein